MRTYYIYKATNLINGKSYIGQTVDPHSRIWQHQRCYEKEQCNFHDAIQEFGFENFEWEIIDSCTDLEKAGELEKHYIKKYDTFSNGYNMTKGGRGGSFWRARPIVQLTLSGEYVKRYDSAGETELEGFHNSDVLLTCKGKSYTCKGFIFMFEDEYLEKGARVYSKPASQSRKSIVQCDTEGNLVRRFESVISASEKTGIKRTRISSVLTGSSKTAGGYIFVYENEFPIKDINKYSARKKGRKVAQINVETGEIVEVFDRIADAGRKLNVNYKSIQKVIDKEERTAYGYKWISQ